MSPSESWHRESLWACTQHSTRLPREADSSTETGTAGTWNSSVKRRERASKHVRAQNKVRTSELSEVSPCHYRHTTPSEMAALGEKNFPETALGVEQGPVVVTQ